MLGVVGAPPGAGTFESLLDEVAMGALDLARADRQILAERFIVVELIEPSAEVVMTDSSRGLGVLDPRYS